MVYPSWGWYRYARFAHETITGLFKALEDKQLFTLDVFDEFILLTPFLTVPGNWKKDQTRAGHLNTDHLTSGCCTVRFVSFIAFLGVLFGH